ncbi:hypothetical protein FDUTEX481_06162 [Tolypothrix sp. PCC 7601]|nr:hypothetical protein FDUTEX481_06162 [Tolypothrix sp. PCC 7601]
MDNLISGRALGHGEETINATCPKRLSFFTHKGMERDSRFLCNAYTD